VIKLEAVRGIPIKKMELDHLCDACVKENKPNQVLRLRIWYQLLNPYN
jgi:hypothetical protein